MKLKQFIFVLVAMLSFSFSSFAQNEAKIGTTEYATLKQAVEAAAAGEEIVLLKNVTLQDGYDADPTAGLRIEKALTINGNKKTIDCGTFKDGIRVYITGSSKADVKFENVTIKNNNPYGRCIDMRTGKIALELKSAAKLIAQGVNSQPLTIGGSSATYRVRVSNATIDAGETGYGIISFVPVTNGIEFSSSVKISGYAALYLKDGANNTKVTMGNGTYTGTNKKPAASGVFGAVVIEGDNNTIVVNHEKSVVKAVAGDDVNQAVQAAFLLKEGATGNKIQVTNANAQVLTEGAQAQWATVATDATNNVLINKGQTVNFAVECGGYLYMDANKAFSMVIPQEKEATTVKLLSDVTLDNTWTVAADQDITLDLNGKTLSTALADGSATNHIYAIDNKGTLKITGNGTINARGIFNYGAMTLEDGIINAIDGNGGYAVRNYAGSLTMNGGKIATTLEDDNKVDKGGYDATTVRVDEGATFTMIGGELNNICDYTFAIENHGTTTVKGGKATSVHTTVANYGTINIEGGEFVCNGLEGITAHAVWAAEGTTNISGGTFNGKDNYNGFNVDASEGAVVNITGGEFLDVHSGSLYGNGTIAVSGGTFFDAVPAKYCATGFLPAKNADGTYGVQEGLVRIGETRFRTLQAAVEAAQAGDEIVVIADIADVTVDVTKNLTISGAATLNNVGINANGADALTVKGLTFTGNSWINSGTAEALTVSGVTATVAPSNTSYTNSRSAFISLGRSEGQELALTLENNNITVTSSGPDAVLGWAKITAATITDNVIKGSNDGYFTNADAIKFMSIANGAEFEIKNNEIYSNYNGIVFAQNTTRDNAYSVSADANKFYGGADHIWIEISGGNTVHATFNATSANTVNGNAFTVDDIKYHYGVIKNWSSYAGVDVVTDANGKVIGGTLASFSNAESVAEGYEIGEGGAVAKASVAEVNGTKYTSLADALAAANAGDEIKLLANIKGDITVPAKVTLNGNGKQISGGILAEGDITFAGVTKAADFDANVANTAVNIPAGASLQLTGSARMVIGHGATFNITGTIEDAKTADKATLVPSLKIAAGASITGNGVTFNVNNAYIVANANTTSKNSNANGTLDFNINNSIWDQTGVLAFYVPTSGKDPVVNFELKNSVLTTTSHLVFSVTKGEIVFDNSLVNQGTARQLENRSTMTIKNGSVVNGAVATSSNAINPGTITVENATYAVTGEFSGAAEGKGTIIIKKGANVSVGSIKAGANVTVDAEGMAAGDEINFTADLSKFTGELSVINNDKLEAKIVDGKVVLATKPVAKVGEQGYATLEAAIKAAAPAGTVDILADITVDKWITIAEKLTTSDGTIITLAINGLTINGNDHTLTINEVESPEREDYLFYDATELNVKNLTINCAGSDAYDGGICLKKGTIENVTFNGGKYAVLPGANGVTVKGCEFNAITSYAIYYEEARENIVVTGNTFNTAEGAYAITMRSNEQFTGNTVVKGRVNIANSSTATVTGNDFGTERFKVYNAAAATITGNTINNLVFNDSDAVVKSTFTDNELSDEAAALLNSAAFNGGTWGGIDWTLTNNGVLTIAPTKGTPVADKNSGKTYEVGAWREAVRYNSKGDAASIEGWPYDRSKVKTLIIKEGVTSIGSFTAQSFTNLTGEVVIPYTVKYIGQEAFQKSTMTKLTFAPVPEGKTGEELCIAQGAFKNLIIEEVSLPADRPVHLHAWVFNNCHNLKTAYIPASVVSVHGTNHIDYFKDFNAHSNPTWTKSSEIFAYNEKMETITFGSEEVRDLFYTYDNNTSDKDYIVATVGLTSYCKIADAIAAVNENGGTIKLHGNAKLEDTWTIPAGKEIILNLNGKTISQEKACTASYAMINNKGNLNIVGSGKISFKDTSAGDPSFGWGSYTVRNEGNLVVEKATIEHLGAQEFATHCIMALYQYSGSTTINGGKISTPNYRSARLWKGNMTINGGTFDGQVWVQAVDNTAKLTVNGGTFEPNGQDASSVFVENKTYDVELAVTDGTFNGKVGCSDAAKLAGAITGGKFTETAKNGTNGALIATGYAYDDSQVDKNGYYVVSNDFVAAVNSLGYKTFAEAYNVAQAGETITLLADIEATEVILLGKSLTINGNGYKVTSSASRVFRVTVANTEVTLNDVNMVNTAKVVYPNDVRGISVDDVQNVKLTLKNCSVDFTDASACDWTYAVNVVGGDNHTITVDGGTYEGANVINVRSTNSSVVVKNATLNCLYPNNDAYMGACIYVIENKNTSVEATGNTFNGDNAYAFNLGNGNSLTESDNIDNTKYVLAKIGDAYYTSIQDAIEAAQDGETVRLIQNVKMDTKTLATQNDGYATIINVAGKAVTLDLNGKKITVDAAAADLANAKGGMLLGVFSADLGGHLTLTDNSDAKNGAVTLNVNDAKVYSMFVSESGQSDKSNSGKITVNGGNYTTVGNVANAMFFADANEVITVNGGNFHCDQVSNTANYPWMFNTLGNNELHVTVNGGTFNVDVNHQHRPFEVKVPETLAVKANGDGTWTVVPAEAYITEMLGATVNEAGEWGHKVGYATIAEAIAAVNELGNKVSIAKDLELTEAVVVPADKTVVLDLNGKTVTMNDASGATAVLLKNNGNLTIMDGTEAKAGKLSFKTTTPSAANAYASNTISNYGTITIESGNVENLSVGGGACYALDNYAGSTATINGGKLTAEKTAVRVFNWTNGEEAKATINMNGGEIYSKNGYGINVNSGNAPFVALNIAGGTITTDYADYKLAVYVVNKGTAENFTANVTGGTFNGIFALNGVTAQTMKQGAVAVSGGTFEGVTCYEDPAYGFVSGGTFKSDVDAKAVATGYICKDNGDGTFGVIVDPKYGKVAQIIRNDYYAENQYFATINEAVQAAVTGETVTLIADVETSAAGYATITDGYAVLVAVKEKEITLNLNRKSVTVTPTAEELENAEGDMLMSVFGMDTNGKLTLTGNGSVKVNANGANVYSLVAAYGEGSAVVIENGNYEADAVMASGSLIYSHEMITVMDGTFNLGNIATGANGSPWIFNTIGQNYTGVKVVGGTYPTDINHQFWANEVLVPEAYALKNNGDGTWTVVDAVAYTNEKATSRNASWRHVGYASLEDAIAATGKYNCQDNTVTMLKDLAIEPITVANGVTVAIDLNGKTISGTDNGTASFGLITNKGNLTINGTGAITLTATQNRGWSAYSSVISNQVGGKLTVNGGTIEHLGGTSMAYAIDNLTNGKGTYAETEINGGEIKSTYRPIRMFLNGVEAQNILTVNAGTIEGTGGNKAAIWMQTAGDVAHSGTLYVGERAVIKNNVYLDADNLKNVREYPVEAYIAKAALAENMTVLADNIPAEAAELVEYDTFWQVEQKNLAELTIEDDCAEYINKIEKNVGVLTYERYFDDTEWQTIVLPFDVPVANLTEQFEVAYIYNASYKGKQATIDYVVIEDAEFVLAANYPYLIKAKAEGWNNIVVEKAKLMPTEAQILDCSSIFEKFSFIGNYATVNTEKLEAKYGYFNLTSGAWSKMGVVNPFRFYMQIELRNGAAFEYPTEAQAIRMRSVNANGEATTGVESVNAEQAGDFIFDLHGRRVVEPQKGSIYIVNGKKVMF